MDEGSNDTSEEIKVQYGEPIGFPIWFTILITIIFMAFASYVFRTLSFNQINDQVEEEDDEVEDEQGEESQVDQITKKQRKKMEKKRAERMEKEALKKEREEKLKAQQEKQAEYDRRYKEREEKRIQQALEHEMEENRIYDEIKSKIVIESQGYVEESVPKADISDFIDYIKLKKMSSVEDLSALLNIKTNNCVERINQLESDNRIFGIINTQGLYLYITQEEVDEFCSFIDNLGRIHKQYDLVPACNRIFRLSSNQEDKEKIDLIYKKLIPKTELCD